MRSALQPNSPVPPIAPRLTGESRARVLQIPASGANSLRRSFGPARLQPRDSYRSPEHAGRSGFAVPGDPVVHLRLSGLPDRQRDFKSFEIYSEFSHLRRAPVLAAVFRQRSI